MTTNAYRSAIIATSLLILSLVGCGKSSTAVIRMDGSSTVYPISLAAAERYGESHRGVRISVSRSGTSAGMQKFLLGEVAICNASRPIRESELQEAEAKGMEIVEFVVGQDGLAIVANPQNDWCEALTVEQLREIWRPEADGAVNAWKDVDPQWPEVPLKLYGPGTASGSFEYFTEVIIGEKAASRPDFTASENDNMLVRGVSGDKGGLGYFGYAYYEENKETLKLLAVDSGSGPVKPTRETVENGEYAPLSRPLFIYVAKAQLQRPEVAQFMKFYVENSADLASYAKYVPVDAETASENARRLNDALPPDESS